VQRQDRFYCSEQDGERSRTPEVAAYTRQGGVGASPSQVGVRIGATHYSYAFDV